MKLPVAVGVRGRYRVTVLDEFGNVERGRGGVPVARDPSGFVRRVGTWRQNLVTDAGLDQMLQNNRWLDDAVNSNRLRQTLRVGDGSGTPAAGDTALDNEVGVTTDEGGFTPSPAGARRSDNGADLTVAQKAVRVYTADGAQNLSEIGFSEGGATDLAVRELVRDASDDPITVSLGDGKKLRVDHDAELVVPLETTVASLDVVEKDAGGNTVQTRTFTDAKIWPIAGSDGWAPKLEPAQLAGNSAFIVSEAQQATAPDPLSDWDPGTHDAAGTTGMESMTPGTQVGEVRGIMPEPDGNDIEIHSFALGTRSGYVLVGGYLIALQDGPHPKADTHQLEIFLEFTLSRS